MMKCEICEKTPADGITTLIRQNPKGEKGIWRCESHNNQTQDKELDLIIGCLQQIGNGSTNNH